MPSYAARFPYYAIDPPWWEKARLLVHVVDAIRLCHDGSYEEIQRAAVGSELELASHRDRANLCDFIQRSRLTQSPLSAFDSHDLLQLLRVGLRSNHLKVVRQCSAPAGAKDNALRSKRRMVAAIEKAAGRSHLKHEGRSYRVIADVDLARLPNRDAYEVVGRRNALAIFENMAGHAMPGLTGPLAQAREHLTEDWRPPFSPDGLVLLRAVIQRHYEEIPADAEGWRPTPPRKSVFDPLAAPEPESSHVDQVHQAATLISAAQAGVPFCEECAP